MDIKGFGAYLREKRKEHGITLEQLGKEAGFTKGYLSNIENGRRNIPSPDILEKLAGPLGVHYEDLMIEAGYWKGSYSKEDKDLFEEIHNEKWTLNNQISELLKSIADDEGIFPDELHSDLYQIIGGLPEQKDGQIKFSNWYFDFIKRSGDDITEAEVIEAHTEFNKYFNYATVKNGIADYNGNKFKEDFLSEIVELMDRHGLSVSVEEQEKALGYPLHIELSEILETSSLTSVLYKGKALTKNERYQILGMLEVLFPDQKETE